MSPWAPKAGTGFLRLGLFGIAGALLAIAPAHAQSSGGESSSQSGSSSQQGQQLAPLPFDVNLTVEGMTDYISMRGYSQTDRDPALQGTLEVTYEDFVVGVFSSNVDFGPGAPHVEIDPFLAYRPSFGNLSLDFTAYYYIYPNSDNNDYPEFFGTASYNFDDYATLSGTLGYSPDYFNGSDKGYYFATGLEVPLPLDFTISGNLAYQEFEKDKFRPHAIWDAGVKYDLSEEVSFDLRYYDTDIDEDRFCVDVFQCGSTVVGSVSVSTSLSSLRKKFAGH